MLVIPFKTTQRCDIDAALGEWLDNRHRSGSAGRRTSLDGDTPGAFSSPNFTSAECRDDFARLAALRDVITDALNSGTLDQADRALRVLETFHEYHAALTEFEKRGFPILEEESSPLKLEWKSAFSGTTEVHTHLVWERANMLWNIAALESYQASIQSCDDKGGWKKQAQHLQAAASVLKHLRTQVVPHQKFTSVEFSIPALQLWERIFLAQAQRATYEVARATSPSKPRHLLLSKLAMAAVPVLSECEEYCSDSTLSSLIPSLVSNWDAYAKAWGMWMSAKAEYHDACRQRESSQFGMEIARLERAWTAGTYCRDFCESAPMDALEDLQNELDFTLDVIGKQKDEAEEAYTRSRSTEIIPTQQDLREIRGELLAKADQPMDTILLPLQTPLFTKLLAPTARQFFDGFRKEMDQSVLQIQTLVEEKTESARKALAAVNLPHSLTAYKQEQLGGGIPEDLWDRVEHLQRDKRVAKLKRDLWELRDIAEAARGTYQKVQRQLDEDLEMDRLFRQHNNSFDGHEASEVQKSFRQSLSNYDRLLRKSQEGDSVLLRRLEILDTDPKYKLLQFQKPQLDRLLPGTGRDGPSIDMSQLSRLLVELSSLFNDREVILNNLKEEIKHNNVQLLLSNVDPESPDAEREYQQAVLSARKSFNGIVYDIQRNIDKQHELVDAILTENERFVQAREASHPSSTSDSCIAMIEDAIEEIEQLAKHLKEGKDFYDVITPKLEQLKQQVGDVSVRLTVERCEYEDKARLSQQEQEDARMAANLANGMNNNNNVGSSNNTGFSNSNSNNTNTSMGMNNHSNHGKGGPPNLPRPMTPTRSPLRNNGLRELTPERRPNQPLPGVEQVSHNEPQVRVDDEKVASLVAMDFDPVKVVAALKKYDNNIDQALNELLSC